MEDPTRNPPPKLFYILLGADGGDNSCYLNQRSHPSYAEIVKFSVGCANTYLDFPIAQGDGTALLPPLPNLGSSLGSSRASTHSLNSENILLTNPPAMINEEVPINEDPLDFMEDDVMEDSPALEAYDSHTEELLQGELLGMLWLDCISYVINIIRKPFDIIGFGYVMVVDLVVKGYEISYWRSYLLTSSFEIGRFPMIDNRRIWFLPIIVWKSKARVHDSSYVYGSVYVGNSTEGKWRDILAYLPQCYSIDCH
ncbi:hypothetical protein Cgig2_014501 [Carnegiea gigantea]|uniref:Uncharacterized protein n=1 Tax=Carnegiea gigantea TaxID=171969 RepID=A0A9Q1JYI3_9CARY|nr:hypothetical protein Cgig2_014501 [Carnegiea gigantea]